MGFPDSTTKTPTRSAGVQNRAATVEASNLKRLGWMTATFDPAKTGVNTDVPKEYLTANQVGDELGWGFPAHRMAMAYEKKGKGVAMWITPQDEIGTAKAVGTWTVTVTTALVGTIHAYIADDSFDVPVSAGATDAEIATAIADKVNADPNSPVIAVAVSNVVTLTAKAAGTYGNGVTLKLNSGLNESLPGGVQIATVAMTGGATDPDIQAALDGNGTGDSANTIYATDCAHGYAPTSAILGKISAYNGPGDQLVGAWANVVGRPMRFVNVDVTPGTAGYTAMKAITDGDKLDRTNAFVGAPDSYRHPAELAAEILGNVAAVNQATPHASYVGIALEGHYGIDRWTDDGTSREAAINSGISCTRVVGTTLTIDGMVTMYRPASIADNNNAYRSFRNISILQNVLNNHREVWASRPSFTIVEDIATVKASEKPFVLDVDGVKDINLKMLTNWAEAAWLFESAVAIATQEVTLREANNGFDIKLAIVLSGEGVVSNTLIYVDISLAVFTS